MCERGKTYTINAKANAMGIKKCIAGILLVWKMWWLHGEKGKCPVKREKDEKERTTYKTGT
jgi:hypothetical protein